MSVFKSISYKNIARRPSRTFILILLSALLCFSVTGGSLAITSLKGGLMSLKSRLGADVMVVPYEATTKTNFSNMILQGNPGYFYMNRSILEKIKKIEGIKEISEQYFLASAKAGCCSSMLLRETNLRFTIKYVLLRENLKKPALTWIQQYI